MKSEIKKMLRSLAVLLLFASTVSAQPPKGMGNSDPEAKKVLDAVSAKFKTFKSVQSKFSLKIENAANKVLGNKSGMVYMKGTKYRISITGQEIFCDGSNVWTLDKAAKEVTISKLDPTNNTITPQKLFTNFYDKDFLYKLNGEVKGIQEIELTPIDKSKLFHKVLVFVSKATKTISSTKIFEKNGDRYTYSVSGMNTSSVIADNMFVFDIKNYPGVNVEDLR
ncbi:MAG: outer membrane lipoprotein carrier protein LolA [Chitinophagaceae bacterium]|nr:outer membrane lipoprotein carrier protein LolA [Chitinophagaceae bacterium]